MSDLRAKVQQAFDEPGCATNQEKPVRERKNGCSKLLAPGAAAGGCAFDGAKIALQPITDVAHLVHGPMDEMSDIGDRLQSDLGAVKGTTASGRTRSE